MAIFSLDQRSHSFPVIAHRTGSAPAGGLVQVQFPGGTIGVVVKFPARTNRHVHRFFSQLMNWSILPGARSVASWKQYFSTGCGHFGAEARACFHAGQYSWWSRGRKHRTYQQVRPRKSTRAPCGGKHGDDAQRVHSDESDSGV